MKFSILPALGLCLALGACGDEPSEASMRQAATATLARLYQGQAMAGALLGAGPRGSVIPTPTVTAFRKVGCVSAQPKPGHDCEFEIALNGIDRGKNRGRFYAAPDGALAMAE